MLNVPALQKTAQNAGAHYDAITQPSVKSPVLTHLRPRSEGQL